MQPPPTHPPVIAQVALGRGADSKRVGIAAGRAQFAAGLRSAFPREGRAIDTFMQWLADARADMAGFAMLKFLPRWLATPLAASGAVPTLFRFFRKAPTTLAAALRDLTDNAELRAVLAYSFGWAGAGAAEAVFEAPPVLTPARSRPPAAAAAAAAQRLRHRPLGRPPRHPPRAPQPLPAGACPEGG